MSDTPRLAHPRYWFSWFGMGVLRLIGWLPFPAIYAISAVLGELFYRIVPARAHVTQVNLKLCFPQLSEQERTRMARRHFQRLLPIAAGAN